MHFNFGFTTAQILWTVTFAALLTLLVVLLGRDRIKRFPWFTASIVLFTVRLLVEVLLAGRLSPVILRMVFLTMADLAALLGLLVVIEVARRAFTGVKRRTGVIWTVAMVAVAIVVLSLWGPWPALKTLTSNSLLGALMMMQLLAQKSDLMVNVLTVELGLAVVLFGRRFKAGWRSHTQQIAIGLSTVSIAWLSVQAVWQVIATTAHPTTEAEYLRILGLGGKLVNANKVVYIAVLVWWIVCLWRDEPGVKALAETPVAAEADETPSLAAPADEEQ
jgi:hypothetical protein